MAENQLVALPAGMPVNEANITNLYGTAVQSAQQHYATVLNKNITSKRVLAVAGGTLAVVAVGSVAVVLIQAVVATAVLGIAAGAVGIGGFAAYKKLPRWLTSIENRERERVMAEENRHVEALNAERNRHLAALKAEARKNPIEQAENDYLRRSQQYEAFKSALEKIGGKVSAYGSRLAKTKKEKPNYDLSQETEAHEKMVLYYDNRKERLKLGYQKLIAFREKLDEARVKWEFQLDANDAIRAMNATDKEARINEILTEVAFDTVQQEFDAIFAKLDIDAAEITAGKELDFGVGTIDVSEIKIVQPQF